MSVESTRAQENLPFECSVCLETIHPHEGQAVVHWDQNTVPHKFCASDLFSIIRIQSSTYTQCSLCNRSIFPLAISGSLFNANQGPRLIQSLDELKSLAARLSLYNNRLDLQQALRRPEDQHTREQVLLSAAQNGNQEWVSSVLNLGPIRKDIRSLSISMALQKGFCDIAILLLNEVEKGDLSKELCEFFLISVASKEGNLEIIQKLISLLENQVDPFSRGMSLIKAIGQNRFDYVSELANGEIDPNLLAACFSKAIEKDSLATVNFLLADRRIAPAQKSEIMALAENHGNSAITEALRAAFN